MNKKTLLSVGFASVLCCATAFSLVLVQSNKSEHIAVADPINYTLTVNQSTQETETNSHKYVLTESGNQFKYYFANAAYDEEGVTEAGAICMLRNNGSGIYCDTPIQSVKSFCINFDTAGTLHVYFSPTKGGFSGTDVYLESGTVYSPVEPLNDVYINIWSNITTYVTSFVVTYACE